MNRLVVLEIAIPRKAERGGALSWDAVHAWRQIVVLYTKICHLESFKSRF